MMKAQILRLEKQIKKTETQKLKIDSLNELGRLLRDVDELQALKIGEEAFSLSSQYNYAEKPYQFGLGQSLANLCELNFMHGKIELSFSQGLKALQIFKKLQNLEEQSYVLAAMGFSHYAMGNYPQAFDYVQKALKYARKSENRSIEGLSLAYLGTIYARLENYEKMHDCYDRSLEILTKINDVCYLATVKNNRAISYMDMGEYDKAIEYGLESFEICKTNELFATQSYVMDTIGAIYLKMEHDDLAKKYFEDALFDKKITINDYGKSMILLRLGQLHMKLKTGSALDYLLQALTLSEKLETKNEQVNIHKLLSEEYEQTGDLNKALHHFKKFHEFDKEIRIKVNEATHLNEELQKAHEEINALKGIIPICSHCKKIRDDSGYWNQIESYIQEHSEAEFSHGMCPECVKDFYGKEKWYTDSLK